eukprot:4784969-Lingulodinium_polyedra.AAC.1
MVENAALKFLYKVTAQAADEDDGATEETTLPVGRLRLFHRVLKDDCDNQEVRDGCEFAHALLSPAL